MDSERQAACWIAGGGLDHSLREAAASHNIEYAVSLLELEGARVVGFGLLFSLLLLGLSDLCVAFGPY